MKRRTPWWRAVVALGGLLGLAAVLAVLGFGVGNGDLATTANWAQLLSVVLAVPTLAVPLWLWWRRSANPAAGAADARGVLAGLVAEQWRGEAKLRSLDDPYPIPVQWRLTHELDVLDHHANLPPAALLFTANSADIGAVTAKFRAMPRRRLVVLGGPGSGKTTLAVQLLRELLATRGHEDEPVPVLLSVAGWDTGAFPRLHDWLAVRLAADYPALRAPEFGSDAPKALATQRRILPVLDGFDELPAPVRVAVIRALNLSMDGDDQLILTSRTAEFTAAVNDAGVLVSAVIIEPEPLEPEAAADYLQRCLPHPRRPGPVWGEILAGLRSTSGAKPSEAVAGVAATPLGLWLLRTVYLAPEAGGPDAADLLPSGPFTTVAALRTHLFDRLIPVLVGSRRPGDDPADPFRPRRTWDPVRVRAWLGYLAHHLDRSPGVGGSTGTRDFAWWRLARDTVPAPKADLAVGLPTGLAVGSLFGGAVGLASDAPAAGIPFGVVFGAATAFVGGVTVRNAATSWSRAAPGIADLHVSGRGRSLVRTLFQCLRPSLFVAPVFGLLLGVVTRSVVVAGLVVALVLVLGVVIAVVIGVPRWAEVPAPTSRAVTPQTSWRADRNLNLMRVVAGAPLGLALGMGFGRLGMHMGWGTAAATGLAFAIITGLTATGTHRAWLAYLAITRGLARDHRLPRRLMPFLDDAHRLGLLRAVGPVYQFRHAELHDHLATAHSLSEASRPGP